MKTKQNIKNKTIINPIALDYIDQYEDEFSCYDLSKVESGVLIAPYGDFEAIMSAIIINGKYCLLLDRTEYQLETIDEVIELCNEYYNQNF